MFLPSHANRDPLPPRGRDVPPNTCKCDTPKTLNPSAGPVTAMRSARPKIGPVAERQRQRRRRANADSDRAGGVRREQAGVHGENCRPRRAASAAAARRLPTARRVWAAALCGSLARASRSKASRARQSRRCRCRRCCRLSSLSPTLLNGRFAPADGDDDAACWSRRWRYKSHWCMNRATHCLHLSLLGVSRAFSCLLKPAPVLQS